MKRMREEVGFGNVPESLEYSIRPSVKPSAWYHRAYNDEDTNVDVDQCGWCSPASKNCSCKVALLLLKMAARVLSCPFT